MAIVLAFLIGVFAGLRSLTAPAAVSWATYLGRLKLDGVLGLFGHVASVAVFTILAVAELVADKLPKTPARTAPLGLGARIVTGAMSGAAVAVAGNQAAILGAVLGAAGGVAGAFGGYEARTRLVKALGIRDLVVALAEDAVAIAGSLLVVSHV
ncbi:MAG TPA: DUF4126 family protein [Gemmataceae bacterium]